MYRFEDAGLRIEEVRDLDTLIAGAPAGRHTRPNVLRLVSASERDIDWRPLARHDVIIRPTWVHWVSPPADVLVDNLLRQGRKQRVRTRKAVRLLQSMESQVSEPVESALLDEWSELYRSKLRELRHGRDFFSMSRKDVLTSPHALVLWRRGGTLVCGCVVGFRSDSRSMVLRFGAVASDWRDAELSRGMYSLLAGMAVERGMRWMTLGSDVNFYGTLVNPGLAAFKLRVGFLPVPGDLFGVVSCRTVVERITDLEGLDGPVLLFGYRDIRGPAATIADFVTGPHALDLVSVSDGGGGILDYLPPHRSLRVSTSCAAGRPGSRQSRIIEDAGPGTGN